MAGHPRKRQQGSHAAEAARRREANSRLDPAVLERDPWCRAALAAGIDQADVVRAYRQRSGTRAEWLELEDVASRLAVLDAERDVLLRRRGDLVDGLVDAGLALRAIAQVAGVTQSTLSRRPRRG